MTMQITEQRQLTKLSDIWEWAADNLTQVRGRYGDAQRKEVCAAGAIAYYWTSGKSVFGNVEHLRDVAVAFQNKFGFTIPTANDELGWTFRDFAQKAREVGL